MSPPIRQTAFQRPTRRAALAILAVAAPIMSANAADAVDRLGIPGPLVFGDIGYGLAWSSHPSATYYKQEYLPAGQTIDTYRSMLMIEVIASGIDVNGALAAQVKMLNRRKGSDPLLNLALIRNDRTGEAVLDFIVGGKTAEGFTIAEWNAYRYAPRRGGDGGHGVMLFAISRRAYGEEVGAFLAGLKTTRPGEIKRLAQHALPMARPGT